MKKIITIAFAALAVSVSAKDIKVGEVVDIDGINYKITSANPALAEVTESPFAEGELDILTEFTHYGVNVKVTRIAPLAFCNGTDENQAPYGTLTVPEGITEIGWQAFLGCNRFDSISLPSSLETIGQAAFYCYSDKPSTLHAVRIAAKMPPQCGEMVFGSRFNAEEGNNRDSIVLYVPVGSVQAYRAEKQWDYFNYIIDFDGEESSTVDEEHYNPDPDEQAIETVSEQPTATKKHIENGMLIIEKNGVKYNALGTRLDY